MRETRTVAAKLRGNRKLNWSQWFGNSKRRARCNYNICSSHAVLYVQPTKTQCDTFERLDDSLTATVVFCFMCRLQGKPNQARDQNDTFRLFWEHEKSNIHKASAMGWKSFKDTKVHKDITQELRAANISEAADCRQYLRGSPFWGHTSTRWWQWRELLYMKCRQLLAEVFRLSVSYVSLNIQSTSGDLSQWMISGCIEEIIFSVGLSFKATCIVLQWEVHQAWFRPKHPDTLSIANPLN